MSMLISNDNFEAEVINSTLPVLVDFYAEWCGPCKMIAPLLEELETEMDGRAKIVKVDVDSALEIASKYKVLSVPTLIFFKDGEIVDQIIGAVPKEFIANKLKALLDVGAVS